MQKTLGGKRAGLWLALCVGSNMVKIKGSFTLAPQGGTRGVLLVSFLLAAGFAAAAEFGEKRDKPGEVQAIRLPESEIPPSTLRTPEEQIAVVLNCLRREGGARRHCRPPRGLGARPAE